MNGPPIYCWTEPVDDHVAAVHARVRVRRGVNVHALTVFVLVEWTESGHHRQARDALRHALLAEHMGLLPRIAHIDDRIGVV